MWFYVVFFVARTAAFGTKDVAMFVTAIVFDIFTLITRFYGERSERNLFKTFYDYRKELEKFRDLIAENLPNECLILSDANKWFFYNKPFINLLSSFSGDREILLDTMRVTENPPKAILG